MTTPVYDYESDWKPHCFSDQATDYSSREEMQELLKKVDLNSPPAFGLPGGIPVIADGDIVWVDDSEANTIAYGETGSKKSRSLTMPLISLLAKARHTMLITDIKGELYSNPKIGGCLKEAGYKTVTLDFRTFHGDGYDLLGYALKLIKEGRRDKANSVLNRLSHAISSIYTCSNDPFWTESAMLLITGLLTYLGEVCKNPGYEKYFNILTLANFLTDDNILKLQSMMSDHYGGELTDPSLINLSSVMANPEKTRTCVETSAYSSLSDFVIQSDLTAMLSHSTWDVRSLYKRPTAVFLIIPDETSAYSLISGMLLDDIYSQLIDEYSSTYQSKQEPKCHIDFVLDEFCNLKINDMRAKISASRSRDMRWFLVAQSEAQLEAVYGKDAKVIEGNCKNIIFLQSSDHNMLTFISDMMGTTTLTDNGFPAPLCPAERLRALQKSKTNKEAVFLRDNYRYITMLPDYDQYPYWQRFADSDPVNERKHMFRDPPILSAFKLDVDFDKGLVPIPFLRRGKKGKEAESDDIDDLDFDSLNDLFEEVESSTDNSSDGNEDSSGSSGSSDSGDEDDSAAVNSSKLEALFNELFGSVNDDDKHGDDGTGCQD